MIRQLAAFLIIGSSGITWAEELPAPIVQACRDAVRRYNGYATKQGIKRTSDDELPIRGDLEESSKYLGRVYRCRIGRAYRLMVSTSGNILEFSCDWLYLRSIPQYGQVASHADTAQMDSRDLYVRG